VSTAGSVLATALFRALRESSVAGQAGVANATWASTTVPRVFQGLGGFVAGRSRGRCPFLEFQRMATPFTRESIDGGKMVSQVIVRAHVCVGDLATADNLTDAILSAALASIRDPSLSNYLAIGSDVIQPLEAGPWGHQRDAVLDIEHSFSNNYEILA
jgi:hypothetical protein